MSNLKIVKNADGLMSKKAINQVVDWMGETGKRVPENRYKMSYRFCVVLFK